ncbi:MAG: S8 family serine peptidase [Planctomycetota bacterium]
MKSRKTARRSSWYRSRPARRIFLERLESRVLLATDAFRSSRVDSTIEENDASWDHPITVFESTLSTGSEGSDAVSRIPTYEIMDPIRGGNQISLADSVSRIEIDAFRDDPRFSSFTGAGLSTVIIDSGIDLDHPHFGPDADNDGVADRIVFHQAFNGAASADDDNGHGTHVAATVASSDVQYEGVAPQVDIIALKTQGSNGSGRFTDLERALQWVVDNAATYDIASVNISIGDGGFFTEASSRYGLGDELAELADMNVIVVSSSGNDYRFNRSPGVGYPSADPNSLSVGSESDSGSLSQFSQRDPELTSVFAPGERITAAWPGGGVRTLQGTSMASPHVSGVAVLAQQTAQSILGRRLSPAEFEHLLRVTGPNRGSIPENNATYFGVDMLALGNAIGAMSQPGPDLRISNLSATSNLVRGDSGIATLTVTNEGTVASSATELGVYLSRNDTISFSGDRQIATIAVPALSPGTGTLLWTNFVLPTANDPAWDPDSAYTLGTVVDLGNLVPESSELNNLNQDSGDDRFAVVIENLPQDLVGSNIDVVSSDAIWGANVELDYSVSNVGQGPAIGSRVEFYLSVDETIDPAADRLLGSELIDAILAGDQIDDRIRLTLPSPSDPVWIDGVSDYFIGMRVDADDAIVESDETNNFDRGFGLDRVAISLAAPNSSVFGTVYHDADNDGLIRPRTDHRFVVTHTFGGLFQGADRRRTFTLTDLPTYGSEAELTITVRGDFGRPNISLTTELDTVRFDLFEGEQPEGNQEIFASRTVPLSGSAWESAIADGELGLVAQLNWPSGSYSTNNSNFVEFSISYVTADETFAAGSAQGPLGVIRNQVTDVMIPSMGTAIGDAELELWAIGFLGAANRTATIVIEDELTLQWLGNASDGSLAGELMVVDSDSMTVDRDTINRWLADGELTATVAFSNGVVVQRLGSHFELRLRYPIASDAGNAGQFVELDLDGDGVYERTTTTMPDDPSTIANESGNFAFLDVPAGNHRLRVVPRVDSVATFPVPNDIAVDVVTGDSPRGHHFGVYNLPDIVPPRIENVWVNSLTWGADLIATFGDAPGYSLVGDHQLSSIAWQGGIDQVTIQFSEDIVDSFIPDHFYLQGADGLNLARADSVSYDASTRRATINSIASIDADRMMLSVFDSIVDAAGNRLDGEWTTGQESPSGDGVAGSDFHFRFNVLSGDVDNSGIVNFSGDLFGVYLNTGEDASSDQFRRFDINGDGRINFSGDLFAVFLVSGARLPETAPLEPSVTTSLEADSVDHLHWVDAMLDDDDEIEANDGIQQPHVAAIG